jgi:hypothetical protein
MTTKLLTEFELTPEQLLEVTLGADRSKSAHCVAKLTNSNFGSKKFDQVLLNIVWRDLESVRADQGYVMEYTYMTTPKQTVKLGQAYTAKQLTSKTTGPLIRMMIREKCLGKYNELEKLNPEKFLAHPYSVMLFKLAKGEFNL